MNDQYLTIPSIINLGIIRGVCPCNCVHCPVGITKKSLRKSVFGHSEMDTDVFHLFCKEVKNYNTTVRLHGVGEPTLHSKFIDILDTINVLNLKKKFWLFTCGIFSQRLLLKLIESIGIIEVSINSIDSVDYLQTKGINKFDEVVYNISLMQELIKRKNLDSRIVLTRVQSDSTLDKEFIKYWSERKFECFVRSYHSYSGLLECNNVYTREILPVLPKCLVPWKRFNLDGTIAEHKLVAVSCFNFLFENPIDFNTKSIVGEFPENSLIELWNSLHFNELRKMLDNNYPTHTSCDRCSERLTENGPRAENLVD